MFFHPSGLIQLLSCLASQPSPSRVNYKIGAVLGLLFLEEEVRPQGKGTLKFPGVSAQRKPTLPQEALGSMTG